MTVKRVVTAILVGLLFAACAGDAASLIDTQWVLVELDRQPPLQGRLPSLRFGADEVGGTTGCNSYFGSYVLRGSQLSFGGLGQTEMACEEPLMEQERAFLVRLSQVTNHRSAEERLEMLSASGEVLLVWEQSEPVPNAPLEGTSWVLESFIDGEAASSILAGSEITLRYQGGRVSGTAGCNDFGGDYSLDDGAISYSILEITVEACQTPPGVMDQEQLFMEILQAATASEVEGKRLTLMTPDGRALVFVSQAADE